MSKTIAHARAVLNVLKGTSITAPATSYLALLTTMTDPDDPSTWIEVTYTGYARKAMSFSSITTVSDKEQMTGPTTDQDFTAIPAGNGSETIVGWAICDHLSNAVSGSALRGVDSTFSKVYAEGDTPRVAASSLTFTED